MRVPHLVTLAFVSLLALGVGGYFASEALFPSTETPGEGVILQARRPGQPITPTKSEEQSVLWAAANSFFFLSITSLVMGLVYMDIRMKRVELARSILNDPLSYVRGTQKETLAMFAFVAIALTAVVLWVLGSVWSSVFSMGWIEIASLVLMFGLVTMIVGMVLEPGHALQNTWYLVLLGMAISFGIVTLMRVLMVLKNLLGSTIKYTLSVVVSMSLSVIFGFLQLFLLAHSFFPKQVTAATEKFRDQYLPWFGVEENGQNNRTT